MKQLYKICLWTFFSLSWITLSAGEGSLLSVTQSNVLVQKFYPNPATQYISFEFDKSVDASYKLEIYSFIGRKMTVQKITSPRITIYFDENYFRGLYVFQLRDASGRIIESGKFQVIR